MQNVFFFVFLRKKMNEPFFQERNCLILQKDLEFRKGLDFINTWKETFVFSFFALFFLFKGGGGGRGGIRAQMSPK